MEQQENANVDKGKGKASPSTRPPRTKRDSNDIAWEYAILVGEPNEEKWQCKKCLEVRRGGAYRIKEHISGYHPPGKKSNVASCSAASDEDRQRCKEALIDATTKKNIKIQENTQLRQQIHIGDNDDEMDEIELIEGGRRNNKRQRNLGPMDRYMHAPSINPEAMMDEAYSKKLKQRNINDVMFKENTQKVHALVARWVYTHGVAFNQIDNDEFKLIVEGIGQYGSGYEPPTPYQLANPLLNKEVEKIKDDLKEHEEEWVNNGCSIMTDAWSDRKRRSIMNCCVNSRLGTTFFSSKEASKDAHTAEYIHEYVDQCIERIGEEKVVQVVTDNASNNMAASDLLKISRPKIFWTPCATHTINLMLEGIGKLPAFKSTINKAKAFTIFVYSHHKTLELMRRFAKKDIIRPGATRFATTFLTLQSILDKKDTLRQMVTSSDWEKLKECKSKKAKEAYAIIVTPNFWTNARRIFEIFEPLVKVLRLVDGDVKPAMGFVYGELKKAKDEIKKVCQNKVDKYERIIDVVESKGMDRVDTPLHLTAYLLNPYYYYKEASSLSSDENKKIHDSVLECIERLNPGDIDMQSTLYNTELGMYKNKVGTFGKAIALRGCQEYTFDPVGWWDNYGNHTPNLQKIARRILSLTTSSSGCERNWSVFEGIHTKKRNRLDSTRMSKLVYVQFNARLWAKKKKKRKDNYEVLEASTATNAQSWIVDDERDEEENEEENEEEVIAGSGVTWRMVSELSGANEVLKPRRSARNSKEKDIRELDEDEFTSEDESDDENEVGNDGDDDNGGWMT